MNMHASILLDDILQDDTQEDIQVYLDDIANTMDDIALLESLIEMILIDLDIAI